MKNLVRISLAALALGVFASAASAQTSGNVVWGALPGNGVTIAGDFGLGVNDDAKIGGASTMYFGGRLGYGANMFSVYAVGGMYPIGNDFADGEVTLGGGLAVHVMNQPAAPVSVSVQAGAGYIKFGDATQMTFGGGPLLGINVPSTGVAIKPWLLPRVQYVKITDFDGEIGFGASGGLAVDMPMGLGFHLGLDWSSTDFGGATVKPLIVGVGVHYAIGAGAM